MLVIAIQAFAKAINIDTIAGVASARQCTECINDNPENHFSTYDSLWEASGGVSRGDFFEFPSTIVEKDILLVPRHHRARTRKKRLCKQALYDTMNNNWQQKLAELKNI